jgi:hypothetical protein
VIVVTGNGRSGTSAVARVLHESGISMGHDLIGPTEFNARGYYEERALVGLNERILAGCDLRPRTDLASRIVRRVRRMTATARPESIRTAPTREQVLRAAAPYRHELARLAATVPASGGWKDPRLCWTLEAWIPYLPAKPRIIVCLRSPEAVSASVMREHGLIDTGPAELPKEEIWTDKHTRLLDLAVESQEAAGRLWSEQYTRLLDVITDLRLDATSIEYDELVSEPDRAVAGLSEFVGRPLDASGIEPSLQHYRGAVDARYVEIYERVRALRRQSA